jgi:serine phosphatase RsbU (regulator of sigma subunit)
MNLTILDILLIITTVAAIAVAVAVMLARRRFASKTARRMDDLYTSQIRDYESEIRRLNTLLDDETRRNKEANPSLSKSAAIAQALDIEKMAAEQKSLEGQQQELTERNQILWDMSVSIEKERQRIEQLKNVIESHHRSVTSSIEYAKLIQDAVLPAEEILKESFADVVLFWRPRDIVSGDFYWMKRIGDTVIFTVADCTGHGVPGAFMSMLGICALHGIVGHGEHSAGEILNQLRDLIKTLLRQTSADDSNPKDGMDIALMVVNSDRSYLEYSGGNIPLIYIRDGKLNEIKPSRNPIGVYRNETPFESQRLDLKPGDRIYLSSDGYPSQFREGDKAKIKMSGYKSILMKIHELPMAEQCKRLEEELLAWRGSIGQVDDICVAGFLV